MNTLLRNTLGATLIVSSALVLGACDRSAPSAATDAATATTVAEPAQAAPVAAKIASVKVGRYIDPKTFAVGGVATKFKQGDKLFAVVQAEGLSAPVSVDVTLLDAQGAPVASDTKTIAAKGTMRANFALTPDTLPPGKYTVQALLDKQGDTRVDVEVR